MSTLDERIEDVATIFDYLRLLRNIVSLGSCNNCGVEKVCGVRPMPGQSVRYNCPFWRELIVREADTKGEEDGK